MQEPLEKEPAKLANETTLAKVVGEEDGYWLYHSNKVDLTAMFGKPEEKLWLVVKDYK